jgi:tetratricopeptide (TPR) repeat protein
MRRAAILLVLCVSLGVRGQTGISVSPVVQRAVQAEYLTDDEKIDLRVFHGLWDEDDLNTPDRLARAALQVAAWDHPVFEDESVDAELRAQALGARGDVDAAIALLEDNQSMRAARIRVEGYWDHGRYEELLEATDSITARLQLRQFESASELVDAVKMLQLRARVAGASGDDFKTMMGMLAYARDEMDRLYWPAWELEAELLIEKDNRATAVETLQQGLSMCPKSAMLHGLQAQLGVDGFNFEAVDKITAVLTKQHESVYKDHEVDRVSPIAAMVGARGYMRQREGAQAGELLNGVLARFPNHTTARALSIAASALDYNFAQTDKSLAEFDLFAPGSPMGLYEVGRVLSEARQYAQADRYLEEATKRLPAWPVPKVERGLMLMQWGKDAEARSVLRLAFEQDPFQVRADNSLRLVEELLTYDTVSSEHFDVRFKSGVDRVMAQEMLVPLEKIYTYVTGLFEHEPDERTIIELMPDHKWFAVRITGMSDIHTIAAATGSVVAMEAPKIGPNHFGVYDWARVVQHEYSHTVTLSKTNNRIPHWFTEAAAVYAENHPRESDTVRMLTNRLRAGQLFDMQEINIAFVRPKKPEDRSFAYAQGHWMYEYIAEEFGDSAPLRMMDLYAQGMQEDEAMLAVLGVSQESFHEMFVEWAWEQARSWGMVVEPSVTLLRFRETLENEDGGVRLAAAIDEFARSAARAAGQSGVLESQSLGLTDFDLATIERLLEEYPGNADLLELGTGLIRMQTGGEMTPELVSWLQRYARARPSDDTPHRMLARHYLKQDTADDLRLATVHLAYLDAREQYSALYARELARVFMRLGELDRAWQSVIRATQIAPFNASNRELAATVALQRRDFEGAEHQLRALVELEPDRDRHKQRLEALRKLREASD